jgi:hypothetical protein
MFNMSRGWQIRERLEYESTQARISWGEFEKAGILRTSLAKSLLFQSIYHLGEAVKVDGASELLGERDQ